LVSNLLQQYSSRMPEMPPGMAGFNLNEFGLGGRSEIGAGVAGDKMSLFQSQNNYNLSLYSNDNGVKASTRVQGWPGLSYGLSGAGRGEDIKEHDTESSLPGALGGERARQVALFEMLKRQQQTQQLSLAQQHAQLQEQHRKSQNRNKNLKEKRNRIFGGNPIQSLENYSITETQDINWPSNMSSGVSSIQQSHEMLHSKSLDNISLPVPLPERDPTGDNQSLLVPCRARGMPMDHNVKTAHFVVPQNMAHGADLICSYDHCRNAGVKFKFCGVCQMPVAKRNFRNRHRHEDVLGNFSLEKVEGLDYTNSSPPESNSTDMGKQELSGTLPFDAERRQGNSSFHSMASGLQLLQRQRQIREMNPIGQNRSTVSDGLNHMPKLTGGVTSLGQPKITSQLVAAIVSTQRKNLDHVPDSIGNNISDVPLMAVDNSKCSQDRDASTNATEIKDRHGSQRNEEHLQNRLRVWQHLILQRPPPEESPEKMSRWLLQVLSTSDPKVALEDKRPVNDDKYPIDRVLRHGLDVAKATGIMKENELFS
jgi:hypothetical protein